MVTDKEGYIQLIEYLTMHLSLFEDQSSSTKLCSTIIETIEVELSQQIMSVCLQNENLIASQRNMIVREVDSILYDLEEILSAVLNNCITAEQLEFIKEFAALLKNLFDEEISIQ